MHRFNQLVILITIFILSGACQRQPGPPATARVVSDEVTAEEATTPPVPTATAASRATATASTVPTAAPSPTLEPENKGTEAVPAQGVEPPPGLLLAMGSKAGGWGLWVAEASGELRLLVEEIAAPTYLPDFHVSPDGRQVLYEYQGDIWRLDVAGGTTENVTQTEERLEAAPRWLPGDSDRFVAGSFAVGSAGPAAGYLTLIGFEGSYEVVDEEGIMGAPPAPSPDGQTIAYSRSGQPFLYHLDGPESGSRPFAPAASGLDWVDGAGEASWSPDGNRLAWTLLGGPEESHDAVLVLFDLAENDYQVIHSYTPAAIGGMPEAPLWDADGNWLLFSPLSFEPEARGLWLADFQGEARRLSERAPRLTHVPDPALSPDGSRLAFSTAQGDAVGLVTAGEWEPAYWQPPDAVGAVGWVTATALASDPDSEATPATSTDAVSCSDIPRPAVVLGRQIDLDRLNLTILDPLGGAHCTVMTGAYTVGNLAVRGDALYYPVRDRAAGTITIWQHPLDRDPAPLPFTTTPAAAAPWFEFALSPDGTAGKQIVWATFAGQETSGGQMPFPSTVWLGNEETGEKRQLWQEEGTPTLPPTIEPLYFSPDENIVYLARRPYGIGGVGPFPAQYTGLYALPLDGGEPEPLFECPTPFAMCLNDVDFERRLLAVSAGDGEQPEVRILDFDGAVVARYPAPDAEFVGQPLLGPDGDVAFIRANVEVSEAGAPRFRPGAILLWEAPYAGQPQTLVEETDSFFDLWHWFDGNHLVVDDWVDGQGLALLNLSGERTEMPQTGLSRPLLVLDGSEAVSEE